MPSYTRLNIAGWSGLASEAIAEQLQDGDPLAYLMSQPHEILKHPRHKQTTTYRADLPPPVGAVIIRHDRTSRPRWSLNTRAIHTLRIHDRLQQAGIDTTQVLAAMHRRAPGGGVEELIISQYVANTDLRLPLSNRRPCSDEEMGRLLNRVGQLFRKVHDAGFIHGDPIPGNVLIAADDRLLLIDNERTRHLGHLPYFFHRERRDNLMRLMARTLGWRPYRVTRRVLEGYYGITGRPTSRRIRREWFTVLRLAQARAKSLAERAAAPRRSSAARS